MQIHELTQRRHVNEGFIGDLAKAGAGAVKGAVGGAVQGIKNKAGQIGAQLKDPNAWFSTSAATAAKGGAQLAQQTQKFAQDLAKQWSVEAGNIPKQAAPAEPPATTTNKTHTGCRVAGQVSMTPNAVRQRQARADKKVVPPTTAPGAPASANTMANAPISKTNIAKPGNLNATPATDTTSATANTAPATTKKTSTLRTKIPKPSPAGGGKTITIGKEKIKPTDPRYASLSKAIPNESLQEALNKELARLVAEAVYKAKTNNPNQQDQQKYVQGRAGTGTGSDATKFAKYDPATSTTANAAQGIDAMARGGQADRQVATTPPATKLGKVPSTPGANQKQNAPTPVDNNAYIQHFKTWSDGKLATKESNTGIAINMDTVKKQFPEMARQLDAALKAVAASSADPKANQQAVTSYLSMALKGVQQAAASIRNDPVNKSKMAAGGAAGGSGFADPRVGNDLAGKLNLDLGAFKNAMGRQPVRPTNNPQVDGLLKAAGLI